MVSSIIMLTYTIQFHSCTIWNINKYISNVFSKFLQELNTFLSILIMMLIVKILLPDICYTNIDLGVHDLFLDLYLKQ